MTLVNCHIQSDFTECISDVVKDVKKEEKFYINVEPTVQSVYEYIVRVKKDDDGNVIFEMENGNKFNKISSNEYIVTVDGNDYHFMTMLNDYSDIHSGCNLTSIDLCHSPTTKYVVGDDRGMITVHGRNLATEMQLKSHVDSITCLKIFPSGTVLLSGSSDMKLKIWSLQDGSNLRTFVGHKGSITDLAFINRGRNFLSSSKDGSIKLWECGTGTTVHSFSRYENHLDGISSIILLDRQGMHSNDVIHHLEYGTENKTVLAGHVSGVITYHDIYTKSQILELPNQFMSPCTSLTSTATCIEESSPYYIFSGYENGVLAKWDMRSTSKAIDYVSINKGASINTLCYNSDSLYISSDFDSCLKLSLKDQYEFGNLTYLVSNDAEIRDYKVNKIDASIWCVGHSGLWANY